MTLSVWLIMWMVFAIPCWIRIANKLDSGDSIILWLLTFITAPIVSGFYTLIVIALCYILGVGA